MPWDCGFLCLVTEKRRCHEVLWRRRTYITNDERKEKRRFLNFMRGFDVEDLRVLRRAIESSGHDIKLCAPGPPMDLVEEIYDTEEDILLHREDSSTSVGCSTTVMSSRPRHSINQLERDRILFQRQKFPELFNPANISQHSAVSPLPIFSSSSAYPTSPLEAPVHFNRNNQRKSSFVNFNKRIDFDENIELMYQNKFNYDGCIHKPSTSKLFDSQYPGTNPIDSSQSQDLGLIPQIDRPMSMPYMCCKLWRWKDLQVDAALHGLEPLPWCRFGRVTINNATVSCCNPYHYALWMRSENDLIDEQQPQIGVSGIFVNNGGAHTAGDNFITNDTGFGNSDDFTTTTTTVATANETNSERAIGHVRSIFKTIEQHIKGNNDDLPPTEPPPPVPSFGKQFLNATSSTMLITPNHLPQTNASTYVQTQTYAWGRMARWERKQRIGEVVTLVGQFVAVGMLAGTVYDGQDVKSNWDIENETSFSLIKQTGDSNFEDIWLYNSGDKPLYICISRTLSNSSRCSTVRRISPGYCFRVHRIAVRHSDVQLLSPKLLTSEGHNTTELSTFTVSETTTTTTTTTTTLISGTSGRLPIIAKTTTANSAATPTNTADAMMLQKVSSSKSFSFLTISVGVGWGTYYQRLYVTDVPCRYEVIFS